MRDAKTVVEVRNLSRSFEAKPALNDVSLTVTRGSVFGLVGENGAGKSTLIKHLLGLWRAQTGSVRVFGVDPVAEPAAVLARVGYLSEQPDLPGWMRVHEVLRYLQAFYPRWDANYAEQLRNRFALDADARVKTLSKGQQARLGLLSAEAHRPELLVLDEPSSGLDPIVRRDILEAIVRTVTDEGRTVIFSSHLLDEVERVSDHLAMLHHGRLVLCEPLDEVRTRHRRMTLQFDQLLSEPPKLRGGVAMSGAGRSWTVICDPAAVDWAATKALGASVVEEGAASLEEIFVAYAGASAAAVPSAVTTNPLRPVV